MTRAKSQHVSVLVLLGQHLHVFKGNRVCLGLPQRWHTRSLCARTCLLCPEMTDERFASIFEQSALLASQLGPGCFRFREAEQK